MPRARITELVYPYLLFIYINKPQLCVNVYYLANTSKHLHYLNSVFLCQPPFSLIFHFIYCILATSPYILFRKSTSKDTDEGNRHGSCQCFYIQTNNHLELTKWLSANEDIILCQNVFTVITIYDICF